MEKRSYRWVIGVDEAGRGPLAGPVAVGITKIPVTFDWARLPGVDDSKQLTAERRAEIMTTARSLRHQGALDFTVAMVGASDIDTKGITRAIAVALQRGIQRLGLSPAEAFIRLDGGLQAPIPFVQATIVRGDALWPEIGLASIVAKETRDAYMKRVDRRYPRYGFAVHKGYGTVQHRAAIARYGLSPIHRATYCKNCQVR